MELITWWWAILAVANGAWAEAGGTSRVALGDWAGGMAEYGYTPDAPPTIVGDRYTTAYLNVSYYDAEGNWQTNKSEDGKFGQNHEFESYGVIVHLGNDHTGCVLPLIGTVEIPTNVSWIALIKRGKCNFDLKVQNAFKHNASGVLVYNDRESEDLDKMKLSDKQRNISAVFTFKSKGEALARLADVGIKVMLNLTIANRCSRPPNHMNRTSVLFVSISFIVLMVMSLSWLVFYYIQRFRYIHAKDRLSKRLCCAAKKALSKIPVKNLKSDDKEIQGDGECCAVCIEPYKISDLLRALPCRHDFHRSCIDPWLLEHRTCPMCKMDILKYYGFVFTGSQESILQLDAEEGERRGPTVISPLPRQASRAGSYEVGHSERSSRASSPDELTPSLHQTQSLQSQPSVGDSPHYSKHHSSEHKRKQQQPSVHSTPSCSRHAVDTTIVSGERVGSDETRDAV